MIKKICLIALVPLLLNGCQTTAHFNQASHPLVTTRPSKSPQARLAHTATKHQGVKSKQFDDHVMIHISDPIHITPDETTLSAPLEALLTPLAKDMERNPHEIAELIPNPDSLKLSENKFQQLNSELELIKRFFIQHGVAEKRVVISKPKHHFLAFNRAAYPGIAINIYIPHAGHGLRM